MTANTRNVPAAVSSGLNSETHQLHNALQTRLQSLSGLLGTTTDPNDAQALLSEMQEVNFRIMRTGSLLFKETTAAIDARIQDVVQASADLDASLKQLTKVNDVIRATSKFLGLVDKVLDKIKLV